ncbi:hypothetical protein PIB30_010384 [Stylosanthes scabra]|uniref:Uncharacterized protein n=1 Tax=Stylosanthes scabra TaxID=79078 RepID=A0ABU6W798_9FABA|nr:hypothetical protein [Stylosanthes scabra]
MPSRHWKIAQSAVLVGAVTRLVACKRGSALLSSGLLGRASSKIFLRILFLCFSHTNHFLICSSRWHPYPRRKRKGKAVVAHEEDDFDALRFKSPFNDIFITPISDPPSPISVAPPSTVSSVSNPNRCRPEHCLSRPPSSLSPRGPSVPLPGSVIPPQSVVGASLHQPFSGFRRRVSPSSEHPSLSSSVPPLQGKPNHLLNQRTLAAADFATVRPPRSHLNLHHLFSATVESRLVFIANFVTTAWRFVVRHALPPSLHVRRSLCTVLAQLLSPSAGCSRRSLRCCSVSSVRKVDMLEGFSVVRSEKVKEELILDGNDIKLASLSCALIN